MKLPLQFILLISLLILTVDSAKTRRCIAKNGKYSDPADKGLNKCRKCQTCHAGLEWDFNADIRTSVDYGDLECLPCIPCKDGHYKDNNIFIHCSPCVLNCETLNRYLQQPCGGLVRGHCGSCKPGFEDIHNNIEMKCTPIQKKNPVTPKLKQVEVNLVAQEFNPKPAHPSTNHLTIYKVTIGLICGLVVACLLGGFLVFVYKRRRTSTRRTNGNRDAITAEDVNSLRKLLYSSQSIQSKATDSDQGRQNATQERPVEITSERPTEILDLDLDQGGVAVDDDQGRHNDTQEKLVEMSPEKPIEVLEITPDQDGLAVEDLVRGEPQIPSFSLGNETEHINNIPLQCRYTVLTKGDPILDTVAAHVYGDNVIENLCSRLDIPKQSCYEQRYFWLNKSQSLKQCVLNVLLAWIEKEGPDATISSLHQVLSETGCDEARIEMETELQEGFSRY